MAKVKHLPEVLPRKQRRGLNTYEVQARKDSKKCSGYKGEERGILPRLNDKTFKKGGERFEVKFAPGGSIKIIEYRYKETFSWFSNVNDPSFGRWLYKKIEEGFMEVR